MTFDWTSIVFLLAGAAAMYAGRKGWLLVLNKFAVKAQSVIAETKETLDETEEFAALLEKVTADNELTVDEIKALWEEGKDIVVAGKDIVATVKKKK